MLMLSTRQCWRLSYTVSRWGQSRAPSTAQERRGAAGLVPGTERGAPDLGEGSKIHAR